MTETIKAIVADPRLLGTISSEQLLDPDDRIIANAMEVIIARDIKPTPHAIRTLLRSTDDWARLNGILDEIENNPLPEELDPQFIIATARESYNDNLLGQAFLECMRMVGQEPANEVIARFNEKTAALATSTRVQSTRDIADNMMQMIRDAAEGKRKAYWRTGEPKFDRYASLAPRKIIVCAAQKKQGKTRFIVDRMMRVHRMNPEVNFIWYSLEMKPEEVMMCQVAWMTGLYTEVMEGKHAGRPTPPELERVEAAWKRVRELPINFQVRAKGIDSMVHDMRRWIKGPTMVIIDNLGLIEIEPGMSDIQHEDRIAKRLVGLRDELDPCIIGLHHLSKESESRWQRDNMYRPNVSHVRGSSRIADYANQVWLLHRPGAYKDLWSGPNAVVPPDQVPAFKRSFLFDVALNRGGEAGEVQMEHDLGCSQFREMKPEA